MATRDRRNFMSLDQVYNYCRALEAGAEKPVLYKILSSLQTVDAALVSARGESRPWAPPISPEVWSQVRDTLFNILIASFPGYFLVYKADDVSPLEPAGQWPDKGVVEFFPDFARRREDGCRAYLTHLDPRIETVLRWCFAEARPNIAPVDFWEESPVEEELEATSLMDRIYDICIEEATRGKKRAHAKWWQLYWQANSCSNRKEKQELNKMMGQLQSVWGKPS